MINQFLTYLETVKTYSKATVRQYLHNLKIFEKFVKKDILEANDTDVKNFLAYLNREKKYTPAGLLGKQATLKSFYKFCMREKKITSNPMEFIESPKLPERQPVYLTDSERLAIFSYTRSKMYTLQGKRDYAIASTFYYTGIRLAELVGLNIGDIHREGNESYLRVIGKGNKERYIPLKKEAEEILNMWIYARPSTDIRNNAIFINVHTKKRLAERSVEELIKTMAEKAGVLKNMTPHIFRHTFATKLLQEGVDLATIQDLLGHASINSTRRYAHTNKRLLVKAVDKL